MIGSLKTSDRDTRGGDTMASCRQQEASVLGNRSSGNVDGTSVHPYKTRQSGSDDSIKADLVLEELSANQVHLTAAAPLAPAPAIPAANGKPASPAPAVEKPSSPITSTGAAPTITSKDPKAAAAAANDMRNVVRRKLTGYVGFANLPNQWHRKSVRKGFNFNVMVVGMLHAKRTPNTFE